MVHESLLALPEWLLVGLGLGVVFSLVVITVFVLAGRVYPEQRDHRHNREGEHRRRVEVRDYLDAIGEQYAENHFCAGQHVAFYLPERDVAITFDARAYYRLERAETHPVLVEHEMPGVQLGERLPFEVPDVEFETEPPADDQPEPPDPIVAAFAELDLSVEATVEEVRAAYRRRAKETHPDQGGDEDEFQRVREAYTTAKRHAD